MIMWLNVYFLILVRWLSSVDAKPGLNKMMLDMLEKWCKDETKYGWVTLMLDAMAIKKHVQYDPQTQTMNGFVDMGDQLNKTDIAFEALVFMVIGFQGYRKTDCILSDQVPNTRDTESFGRTCIEELHHRQIRVVCVTIDGHASNVSMCMQLGCHLKANPCDPLKTHSPHPVTQDNVLL